MKHLFILNPAAGKHQSALALEPAIIAACEAAGCSYEILHTKAPGDATRFTEEAVAAGGPVRIYACGGDGTLLEVMTGLVPGGQAEFTHIPCGSGNDFVRMFGGNEPFLNLEEMVRADTYPVDGIECTWGEGKSRRSLNIAATGMDATVAHHMARFKRWPLVSGPMAYNLALVKVFFGKLGSSLKVEMDTADGPVTVEGRYLFALCANGQYYGGGYNGAPLARPDDGVLDFLLVEKMSRLRMLNLLPKYKAGTHLGKKGVHLWHGTAMTVHTDKPTPVSLDGECFLTDRFSVRILPGAYRMVFPPAVAPKREAATV